MQIENSEYTYEFLHSTSIDFETQNHAFCIVYKHVLMGKKLVEVSKLEITNVFQK